MGFDQTRENKASKEYNMNWNQEQNESGEPNTKKHNQETLFKKSQELGTWLRTPNTWTTVQRTAKVKRRHI